MTVVETTQRRDAERRAPATTCCSFVVFGGTGDLARRKVLPALYTLRRQNLIGDQCIILGVSRDQGMDDAGFRALMREAVAREKDRDEKADAWIDSNVFYCGIGQSTHDDFVSLRSRLRELESSKEIPPNRVFYLAIPPGAFPSTLEELAGAELNQSDNGWTRIVIEKPFGRDLATATQLNRLVHHFFDESQVYRIDHYLGKETVQNLLVFRFANAVFESLWNRDHVQSVQITVAEDIGIGERAGYYEQAGLVRDILQNHGTQLLALVAMEVPAVFDADSIRQEKVKALRSIAPIAPNDVVFGQYVRGLVNGEAVPAYREEHGVSPTSNTETFAAIRLEVNSWRWQGVPFYLRAGKRLAKRLTEIVIKFRRPPVWMFAPMTDGDGSAEVHSNVLRVSIQPEEGFALFFDIKAPGKPLRLDRLPLDHYYHEEYKDELPEAYQTLLMDVIEGDQTLFVRSDEVEQAWKLFDPILTGEIPLRSYPPGTWGPPEADELLARDGQRWFTGDQG